MPMEEDHVPQDIGVFPMDNAGTQYAVYKIGLPVKRKPVFMAVPWSRKGRRLQAKRKTSLA
jgi:hypothetical protein